MDSVIRFELMMKNGFAGRCLRPLGYTEKLIGEREKSRTLSALEAAALQVAPHTLER